MIRHIVMMKWRHGTTDDQVAAVVNGLSTMPDLIPGIKRYEYGSDLGLNDGNNHFALVADFESVDDFRGYSVHPEHLAVIDGAIKPIIESAVRVQYEI